MAAKQKQGNSKMVHWGRFLLAILAILIAATHIPYLGIGSGGSSGSHAPPSGSLNSSKSGSSTYKPSSTPLGFQALALWLEIETIAYTVIAVVYLLGIRRWYAAAAAFNAFNVVIYFLSGMIAIPGITSMAFGNRLSSFGTSLSGTVLIVSWIALLILSIVFLKYDKGSELQKEI